MGPTGPQGRALQSPSIEVKQSNIIRRYLFYSYYIEIIFFLFCIISIFGLRIERVARSGETRWTFFTIYDGSIIRLWKQSLVAALDNMWNVLFPLPNYCFNIVFYMENVSYRNSFTGWDSSCPSFPTCPHWLCVFDKTWTHNFQPYFSVSVNTQITTAVILEKRALERSKRCFNLK